MRCRHHSMDCVYIAHLYFKLTWGSQVAARNFKKNRQAVRKHFNSDIVGVIRDHNVVFLLIRSHNRFHFIFKDLDLLRVLLESLLWIFVLVKVISCHFRFVSICQFLNHKLLEVFSQLLPHSHCLLLCLNLVHSPHCYLVHFLCDWWEVSETVASHGFDLLPSNVEMIGCWLSWARCHLRTLLMLFKVYRTEILCSRGKRILVDWPQSAGFCCVKSLPWNLDIYFGAASSENCLLISLLRQIRILWE